MSAKNHRDVYNSQMTVIMCATEIVANTGNVKRTLKLTPEMVVAIYEALKPIVKRMSREGVAVGETLAKRTEEQLDMGFEEDPYAVSSGTEPLDD